MNAQGFSENVGSDFSNYRDHYLKSMLNHERGRRNLQVWIHGGSYFSYVSYIGFSIAVKSHHDHSNPYKEIIWGGLLTVSEVQFTIIMAGNMTAGRQTCCWRRN